jgi:OOP family OmpA-OmpF porin
MKYGILAVTAAAAFAAAASARADDADYHNTFYLGGGVGEYSLEVDDFDDVTTTIEEYDSDDTAWKAFGGWHLNQWLALEVAYVNLGNPEDEIAPDTFARVETDGFAPYIVGRLPLGIFEAFAKAGYYFHDTNVRVTSPLGVARASDSGEDFTWSTGLGLNLADRFNLRLEYEQFDFDGVDDSNALWLTGSWRF